MQDLNEKSKKNTPARAENRSWVLTSFDETVGDILHRWARLGHRIHNVGGHTGVVEAAAFTPDGEKIVTGGYDRIVRLWEIRSGRCLRTFEGHRNAVGAVSISPDARFLVTADHGYAAETRTWELQTGKPLAEFENTLGIAEAIDDRTLAAASYSALLIRDIATGRPLRTLKAHADHLTCLVPFSKGRRIVTCGRDRKAFLWDVRDETPVAAFTGHEDWVIWAAASEERDLLATGSNDGTARLYRMSDAECFAVLPNVHRGLLSSDGKRLISWFHHQGAVRISTWDTSTGEKIRDFSPELGTFDKFCLARDGAYLLTGGVGSPGLQVWDVDKGVLSKTHTYETEADWVCRIFAAPDPQRAVVARHDNSCYMIDIETNQRVAKFSGQTEILFNAFFLESENALVAVDAKSVKKWDLESGRVETLFSGIDRDVSILYQYNFSMLASVMAATPDGKTAVVKAGDRIGVLDLTRKRKVSLLDTNPAVAGRDSHLFMQMTDDGKTLVLADPRHDLKIFDIAGGNCLHDLGKGKGAWLERLHVLSKTGRMVISFYGNADLWDIAAGEKIRSIEKHRQYKITAIDSCLDDSIVATLNEGGEISVRETASGKSVASFPTRKWYVNAMAFAPDGAGVVVGGQRLTLWDVATGKLLAESSEELYGKVYRISMFPRGDRLFTLGADHKVRFWKTSSLERIGELHNIDRGFLWTVAPDETATSGWFWTDRTELISVVECDRDGAVRKTLGDQDPRRDEYVRIYNRRGKVMPRIADPENFERQRQRLERAASISQDRRKESTPGIEWNADADGKENL